ncbi:SURF1 family protein [Novosphingobium ginsenosidimutans]|uniref:SURF1-like protein n=1 Tax=Novosphingobium ginsenosidimutans TaxID=1176536 RepID=A0A5B8S763_9SPHN|nr:SURF1 family protein [Novosphingobium ginsenosidimutans]QEA17426.1 SURF1 family protein [Novosphingobium ginsenosidimutans]
MRRLPIIPTVLVLAAVGVMIALGFWQLDRRAHKEAMLARYATAQTLTAEVSWPIDPAQQEAMLFRRTTLDCRVEGKDAPLAGYDRKGTVGWAHAVTCVLPGGARAEVVLGWAKDLAERQWRGGTVRGVIAPGAGKSIRLIADPPLAGLAASALPDPKSIPNNHWSYAIQWFLFAGVALVIYALALRKRLAARGDEG